MNRRNFIAAGSLLPLATRAAAQSRSATSPAAQRIDFKSVLPASGTFPEKWICGSPACMNNQDPPVQVHWYNEHTVFMRQNKAWSYEAPFPHLYFGNDRALLLDQGFVQLRTDWAFRDVVDDCIAKWCQRHGR